MAKELDPKEILFLQRIIDVRIISIALINFDERLDLKSEILS
jgi:hypothetical protein